MKLLTKGDVYFQDQRMKELGLRYYLRKDRPLLFNPNKPFFKRTYWPSYTQLAYRIIKEYGLMNVFRKYTVPYLTENYGDPTYSCMYGEDLTNLNNMVFEFRLYGNTLSKEEKRELEKTMRNIRKAVKELEDAFTFCK